MLTSDDIFDWYDVEWYFCYKYVIARHLRSVEVGRWKEKDLPTQNFSLRVWMGRGGGAKWFLLIDIIMLLDTDLYLLHNTAYVNQYLLKQP